MRLTECCDCDMKQLRIGPITLGFTSDFRFWLEQLPYRLGLKKYPEGPPFAPEVWAPKDILANVPLWQQTQKRCDEILKTGDVIHIPRLSDNEPDRPGA